VDLKSISFVIFFLNYWKKLYIMLSLY
jgi:hypothetical protein